VRRTGSKGSSYFRKAFFLTGRKITRLRWGFQTFTEYDGCLDFAGPGFWRERFASPGRSFRYQTETYGMPIHSWGSSGLKPLPSRGDPPIQPLSGDDGAKIPSFSIRPLEEIPVCVGNLEEYRKILDEAAANLLPPRGEGWTGYPLALGDRPPVDPRGPAPSGNGGPSRRRDESRPFEVRFDTEVGVPKWSRRTHF
jgi:hypothetical protein